LAATELSGTRRRIENQATHSRRLLGHPNISTTQRYMHLDDNEA
jgi:site-specific recombinase XerC